jgi:hypothetical protein
MLRFWKCLYVSKFCNGLGPTSKEMTNGLTEHSYLACISSSCQSKNVLSEVGVSDPHNAPRSWQIKFHDLQKKKKGQRKLKSPRPAFLGAYRVHFSIAIPNNP